MKVTIDNKQFSVSEAVKQFSPQSNYAAYVCRCLLNYFKLVKEDKSKLLPLVKVDTKGVEELLEVFNTLNKYPWISSKIYEELDERAEKLTEKLQGNDIIYLGNRYESASKILTEGILGTIKSWSERNKIKYDFGISRNFKNGLFLGFGFKSRLSSIQASELKDLLESKKYASKWKLNSKALDDKLTKPFDSIVIPIQ